LGCGRISAGKPEGEGKRPRVRWSGGIGRVRLEVGRREVGVGKLEKTDVVRERRRCREVERLDFSDGLAGEAVGFGVLDNDGVGEARGVMSNVCASSLESESEGAWLSGSSCTRPTTGLMIVFGLFLGAPHRPAIEPPLSALLLRLVDCSGVLGLSLPLHPELANDVKSTSEVTKLGILSELSVLVGLGRPSSSKVSVLDFREFDASPAGGG